MGGTKQEGNRGKGKVGIVLLLIAISLNCVTSFNLQYRDGVIVRDFAAENSHEEQRNNYIEYIEHLPEWNPAIYIRNEQNNLGLITRQEIEPGTVILTNRYPNSLNTLDIMFVKHFKPVVDDFAPLSVQLGSRSDFYLQILYLLAEDLNKFDSVWLNYELHQLQLHKPIHLWDDPVALSFLEGSCLLNAVKADQEIDKSVFERFMPIFEKHKTLFNKEITFDYFLQIKALVQKKLYTYSEVISATENQKTITINNASLFGGIDIARHTNDEDKINAEVRIICPDNVSPFICSGSLVALKTIKPGEEIFISRSFDHLTQTRHYNPSELYRLYSLYDFEYVENGVSLLCDIVDYFTVEQEGITLGDILQKSGLYVDNNNYLDFTLITKESLSLGLLRIARLKSLDRGMSTEYAKQIISVINSTSVAFSITSELKAIYKISKALQKRLAKYEPIRVTDLGGNTPIYQQIALWLRSNEISVLQNNLQLIEQYWVDFLTLEPNLL